VGKKKSRKVLRGLVGDIRNLADQIEDRVTGKRKKRKKSKKR
jgi:hypothetical protein